MTPERGNTGIPSRKLTLPLFAPDHLCRPREVFVPLLNWEFAPAWGKEREKLSMEEPSLILDIGNTANRGSCYEYLSHGGRQERTSTERLVNSEQRKRAQDGCAEDPEGISSI